VGIHGVNRDLLVDIDETGVWMACCRRTKGHAPRGQSATTHAPYNPRRVRVRVRHERHQGAPSSQLGQNQ
jgi:hypothetical protein